MKASGTGARANSFEKTALLLSDVTVDLEPATKIKSDGPLEVSFNDNMAVFSDNVRVRDKDGDLKADKLMVYFDPDTRRIAKVVAEGDVKLLKGESYTLCEKAVYTEGTGSVEFIGKPRIVIAPAELQQEGLFSDKADDDSGGLGSLFSGGSDEAIEEKTPEEKKEASESKEDILSLVENISNT